jgi:hypothetical protein
MYLHIVELVLKRSSHLWQGGKSPNLTQHTTPLFKSANNDVFSFASQHQPPRGCSDTSIDGNGKVAPAKDSGANELVNAGAAKGQEEMAVPAMTTNATRNATPGSPPASAAANNATNNDDNDEDDNNGINLDALRRRVRDLRHMLNGSLGLPHQRRGRHRRCACIECARTSELAKRSAGKWIRQVKEELRRTRIEAKRFRAGWTRLHAVVGGGGGGREGPRGH